MHFPKTRQLLEVKILPECGSTNTELAALLTARSNEHRGVAQCSPLLVVSCNQTAGRGRLARAWEDTPGVSLASSLYIPGERLGELAPTWVPLLAGAALTKTLAAHASVILKWPNDVLVPFTSAPQTGPGSENAATATAVAVTAHDPVAVARGGAKLAGILCESVLPAENVSRRGGGLTTPDAACGVIVGTGINIGHTVSQLAPGATSLRQQGVTVADMSTPEGAAVADGILAAYITELLYSVDAAAADVIAAHTAVTGQLATLGASVRAELPDGSAVTGTAVRLTLAGELVVRDSAGMEYVLSAGDVFHLRNY